MRIVYTPAGGERHEWDFKPAKLMSVEAEAIERHTGWTYEEFGKKFMAGSALARHAILWVLLKRKNPGLRYTDVTFAMDEFFLDLDAEEYARTREAILAKADLTEDERNELLEHFPAQDLDEGADVPPDPKDEPPAG